MPHPNTNEITMKVQSNTFNIVHVHVANLANILYDRGIPYVFSFHDHHAYLHGKESDLFNENLKAIKNSIITLVPAKFLVEYFDHPKVIYFSHGVNTDIFNSNKTYDLTNEFKLLCVANNGWANSAMLSVPSVFILFSLRGLENFVSIDSFI